MLDSHVEALAFNYVNFGFFTAVNNLWTWIAVVMAAFSFWKIRAASSSKDMIKCIKSDYIQHAHAEQFFCDDEKSNGCESEIQMSEGPSCMSIPVIDMDGSTKGKFALYYYEDSGCMEREEEATDAAAAAVAGVCEDSGEWWVRWEKVLRVRTGEIELYSYQDLSLINGNVVRVWDDSYTIRR